MDSSFGLTLIWVNFSLQKLQILIFATFNKQPKLEMKLVFENFCLDLGHCMKK